MNERNQRILRSADEGLKPVLPYEYESAQQILDQCALKQEALGRQMFEATTQSSETWHDNSPFDATVEESKILSSIAERAIAILKNAEVFEFDTSSDEATLGSAIDVEINGDKQTICLIGTSEKPTSTTSKSHFPKDSTFASIISPIGKCLLGTKAGDEVSFHTPRGIEQKIRVIRVY